MLKENVPISEAEKMVADGARILEHKHDADDNHVCLVEVLENGGAEASEMADRAKTHSELEPGEDSGARTKGKRRGRPPKASKG